MTQQIDAFFKSPHHIDISGEDLLSWMFDDRSYDLGKPIYIDASNPARSISARQARSIIRRLVAGFCAAGLEKGDTVCLHSFNDIYYSLVFLGVIAAGGIWSGTNPGYTQYELLHHMTLTKAKFIITEPELLGPISLAAKQRGIGKNNIFIFNMLGQPLPSGYLSWLTLLDKGERDWVTFNNVETAKQTTAALLFSSGTTGLPKAAIISHHNLVAQHTLVHEVVKKPWVPTRLMCLPFFHAASIPMAHIAPLRSGEQTYVMRRFDLEPFLQNIERYGILELPMVPPLIVAIIMSPLRQKYSLKSLKWAICGAAPLDSVTQSKFKLLMHEDAYLTQCWGMSETTCIAMDFKWPEGDETGSCGRLLRNMDLKLVDDDGKDISCYDVRGEICVKGPIVISGYLENDTANAASFRDGWFHTGDIAYCDSKSKKWYIVDRKKELIKVRGFQVSPAELEAVLLSHPQIVDAAVIGVSPPRKDGSEVPRAYVTRLSSPQGTMVTVEEIKKLVSTKLASYKQLEGGVIFIDTIPKNASGKILKKILVERAKIEMREQKL
ncbi:related to 4-coumarate--CoA ligase [Phialocephala subalpina]|uniref:Related to 4-coumarate--CoA ligase n=1 Tax=Phialocephala subalpina TaxID=576137 RepID=A0A1L7XLP0_9HELO|nr:related to 4-coumarate--CoA ligase [Phialocephala subalpina]